MIRRLVQFTVRHSILTIFVIGLMTLFFAYQIWNPWMAARCMGSLFQDETACWWSWKIKMVVDPTTILPQDHPYVQLNNRIEKTFGGSRVVVIGVESKSGDIFTAEGIAAVHKITEAVKQIPSVKEENVVSITDRKVKHVENRDDTIAVERLMGTLPKTPEELAAFRKRVFSNELYLGGLISRDGRAAAIITDFRDWVPAYESGSGSDESDFGSDLLVALPETAGGEGGQKWPEAQEGDAPAYSEPEGSRAEKGAAGPGDNPWWDGQAQDASGGSGENPWWQGGESDGAWPSGSSGGYRMSDSAIYKAIQEVSAPYLNDDLSIHIGGLPVALAFMEKDSARIVFLFPLALLVMMVILFWAFRSFQGMLLPLLTALLSVVWALGLMGLSGIPMDPFNTLTPILILAVAAGHSIQILKRYYEELAVTGDNKTAVIEATTKIAPVTITAALVAAASFSSLITFQLKTFQAFGLLTAFGIISALVLELTFIPALRSLLPVPRGAVRDSLKDPNARPDIIDRFLLGIAALSTGRRPFLVLGTALVILIVALTGTTQVRVDNSLKKQFFEFTRLRVDEKALNRNFAGTSTFYILVEGDRPGALKDPKILAAIDKLQRRMEAIPEVGRTESFVDYLKTMNQTFHGGDEGYNRVPEDRQLAADYLFLYTVSGNPADFARLVDYNYRQAVIWSYLKTDSTTLAEELIRVVEDYAQENGGLFTIGPPTMRGPRTVGLNQGGGDQAAPGENPWWKGEASSQSPQDETLPDTPKFTLGVAGSAPVTVALNRTMVDGKIRNILQVAAIIFMASSIVLRSWSAGLLVLLPLSLAVLINFGVMGLTGITLGIGTAAISAMAVGIGADYAIYLLFRIREEYDLAARASRTPSLPEAVRKALLSAGKAIVFVALSISAGYAILPYSGYYLHMEGILVPLAMMTSCIGALMLLSTLVCLLRPRFVVSR